MLFEGVDWRTFLQSREPGDGCFSVHPMSIRVIFCSEVLTDDIIRSGSRPLNLPDLDALNTLVLSASILEQQDLAKSQHDQFKAQPERHTAARSSRAIEIDRLTLLVAKLAAYALRSEKREAIPSGRQVAIEDLVVARPIEDAQAISPEHYLHRQSRSAVLCLNIFARDPHAYARS